MNRLLHSLLRPSTYGAVALAAAAVAGQYHQQQQQKQDSGTPQAAMNSAVRVAGAAAAATAQSATAPKNQREERFLKFASVEYNGVPYMTPEDFLESVTQEQPRYRQERRPLAQSELEQILRKTPTRWWASTKLMRGLGQEGIVSYPEYLFLLCTLANPKSAFAIAFKMIDLSRNQRVEKSEFATLNTMVSSFTGLEAGAGGRSRPQQDTTLMRHFFGRSGRDSLDYAEFVKFMSNLQYEVLEIEFIEFSKGFSTIAESDFVRVLLRYSNLPDQEQARRVEQIKEKLVREEGIGFEDFRLFFQFINSLQDLAMALRMFDLAGHPVTQDEFQRAVKACVGYNLAPRVVSTVFLLLDRDGDGSLSSEELLGILRGRIKRLSPKSGGGRSSGGGGGGGGSKMAEFKKCLKREIQKGAS